jgi:hypothetical protein
MIYSSQCRLRAAGEDTIETDPDGANVEDAVFFSRNSTGEHDQGENTVPVFVPGSDDANR